jgi:hypothetical protein
MEENNVELLRKIPASTRKRILGIMLHVQGK